jgi:DNA mismatch endonuclease, patch repair protein
VDIVASDVRSRMMSGIRGRNTKPERLVRSYLHKAGLRYSLHRNELPGRPDIVLRKYAAVVFVNGCFWHRHQGCRFAYRPKSNVKFWNEKISGNVRRDAQNYKRLRRLGWRVFVVWECGLDGTVLDRLIRKIKATGSSGFGDAKLERKGAAAIR